MGGIDRVHLRPIADYAGVAVDLWPETLDTERLQGEPLYGLYRKSAT